jgi:hypothetical protein
MPAASTASGFVAPVERITNPVLVLNKSQYIAGADL